MAQIYNEEHLHEVIAHMRGVKVAVGEFAAGQVFPRAQAIFAQHDRAGGHQITLGRPGGNGGITDAYVYLEGPVPHIVEWGRAAYITSKDQRIGNNVIPKGTRIAGWEGTHVLRRTYESF